MTDFPSSPVTETDIVERLRAGFFCREEAANEIERLRRDIAVKARILTNQSTDIARLSSDHAQCSKEPIALINRRLEDLAEANAIYGKDQRLNAPDKIARNEREISWLKDLRSTISLSHSSTIGNSK